MGAVPPVHHRAHPLPNPLDNGPEGVDMALPLNPKNVPTDGTMTYAALERVSASQLKLIRSLQRTAGNPPTWEASCTLILGDDWDGVYETLSMAAGSWLIHNLQAAVIAVSKPGDLDMQESPL